MASDALALKAACEKSLGMSVSAGRCRCLPGKVKPISTCHHCSQPQASLTCSQPWASGGERGERKGARQLFKIWIDRQSVKVIGRGKKERKKLMNLLWAFEGIE